MHDVELILKLNISAGAMISSRRAVIIRSVWSLRCRRFFSIVGCNKAYSRCRWKESIWSLQKLINWWSWLKELCYSKDAHTCTKGVYPHFRHFLNLCEYIIHLTPRNLTWNWKRAKSKNIRTWNQYSLWEASKRFKILTINDK